MALPLAYVSNIQAKPIYRRKAVTRLRVSIYERIDRKKVIYISVAKSKRDDKSDVCYLASQLELKVIRMVMNEKYFPKRARFVISNRIVDLAMDISENFDTANDIFPNSEENLKIRERFQVIGRGKFRALNRQLNIAYLLFNIPSGVMDEVFDLISQIDKKYKNWFKSGRKVLNRELAKQASKEGSEEEPKPKDDESENDDESSPKE